MSLYFYDFYVSWFLTQSSKTKFNFRQILSNPKLLPLERLLGHHAHGHKKAMFRRWGEIVTLPPTSIHKPPPLEMITLWILMILAFLHLITVSIFSPTMNLSLGHDLFLENKDPDSVHWSYCNCQALVQVQALSQQTPKLNKSPRKKETSPSRAWLRLNAFLVLDCLPSFLPTCSLARAPMLELLHLSSLTWAPSL